MRSSEAVDKRVRVKVSLASEPEQECAQAGVQCQVIGGDSGKDSYQRTLVQIKACNKHSKLPAWFQNVSLVSDSGRMNLF